MLTLTLSTHAAELLVHWRYGTVGALALTLVSFGHKTHNQSLTCLGLTTLALLLAQ